MKAQLSFEYYFSLIVFIIFVSSLFFKLITFFPNYSSEVTNQILRSEAYQISELLVNDVGYPGNWHTDVPNAKRLGLSDETKNKTNLLSSSKIAAFDNLCRSNYNNVLELMDIDRGFSVLMVDKGSEPTEVMIDCLPAEISARSRAEVRRIVDFGSSYGEVVVQVWKE